MSRAWRTDGFRPPRGSAARPAEGFTLIELIVTMTVAGVLGMAILALVLGQNRFYGHSDDVTYAQQSLRAAMDLMASELRMASPRDLVEAEADRVRIRFDLERAVVCERDDTNDRAHIYVYDVVGNANLPAGFRGAAFSGPYTAAWSYGDDWTGTSETSSTAKSVCVANGAPDVTPASRYRRVGGWTAKFGSVPEQGSLVRFYGQLTYRFAESGFGEGVAVWRNDQELVSPFDDGATFHYVLANGLVLSSVPDADLLSVRTIRIDVTAEGDGPNRYDVQRSISYDVPLRN